jgi:outer membrane protein OmpA-like peptidoglycan-associated protein
MRRKNAKFVLAAMALMLSVASVGLAQENATSEATTVNASANTRSVPDGQKFKVKGVVTKSNAESFTLREPDGTETVITLTAATKIKAAKRDWFSRYKPAGPSSILRGLRLEAEGRGNQSGELVAEKIRFNEQDFRTAQALEARVEPVETLAQSTKVLAESNQGRIAVVEQNDERLSGQLTELSAIAAAANDVAKGAQVSADRAQATADHAQADANADGERINALDTYDPLQTFTVHFRPGSAKLTPAAKAQIDEVATKVRDGNLKGWVMEITGYADAIGNTARNRSLSERRANEVINYLVTTYNLPLRRLVQPFGYGESNPVAKNDSRIGRSLNRRVEIKILVNKGLSQQASM